MEFDEVVKNRRSVRSFDNKRVSWKRIIDAVECANQNPFAGNFNNIKFLVVEDSENIKIISRHANQSWMEQSSIIVLVCSDEKNLENLYGERGRIYSRQQAGAVIQTFLLKIADMGLSACWVGAFSDESIKPNLGIPKDSNIEAIIPVGYPKISKMDKKQKKRGIENSIYWDNWKVIKRPSIFKEPTDEHGLK